MQTIHYRKRAYMAGLMTAPMVIIELLVMRSMNKNETRERCYPHREWGWLDRVLLVYPDAGRRFGQAVLRSMIPHHAAAILMCERASLQDPEIEALCERIRTSQQSEIEEIVDQLILIAGGYGEVGRRLFTQLGRVYPGRVVVAEAASMRRDHRFGSTISEHAAGIKRVPRLVDVLLELHAIERIGARGGAR